MHCEKEERKELLRFIQWRKPELEAAFRYDQLATISRTGSGLSNLVAEITGGKAASQLKPELYLCVDNLTRKDHYTQLISKSASDLGRALAALDILAAVSGSYQQDFYHAMESAYNTSYNQLKELCYQHGYREGE